MFGATRKTKTTSPCLTPRHFQVVFKSAWLLEVFTGRQLSLCLWLAPDSRRLSNVLQILCEADRLCEKDFLEVMMPGKRFIRLEKRGKEFRLVNEGFFVALDPKELSWLKNELRKLLKRLTRQENIFA